MAKTNNLKKINNRLTKIKLKENETATINWEFNKKGIKREIKIKNGKN